MSRAGTLVRACDVRVCPQSPAMLLRARPLVVCFALIAGTTCLGAAEAPLSDYARVEVAPAKTSIYVGSVSMTMPTFTRAGSVYESTYVAKVFPYFFYNENGRLTVEISDDALRQLERGEPIDFKGQAVREDGAPRRVEGRAIPADSRSGKLKVRVFYSKRIELIFNTTYRFPDTAKPPEKSPPR
jgi:hypothetical protein